MASLFSLEILVDTVDLSVADGRDVPAGDAAMSLAPDLAFFFPGGFPPLVVSPPDLRLHGGTCADWVVTRNSKKRLRCTYHTGQSVLFEAEPRDLALQLESQPLVVMALEPAGVGAEEEMKEGTLLRRGLMGSGTAPLKELGPPRASAWQALQVNAGGWGCRELAVPIRDQFQRAVAVVLVVVSLSAIHPSLRSHLARAEPMLEQAPAHEGGESWDEGRSRQRQSGGGSTWNARGRQGGLGGSPRRRPRPREEPGAGRIVGETVRAAPPRARQGAAPAVIHAGGRFQACSKGVIPVPLQVSSAAGLAPQAPASWSVTTDGHSTPVVAQPPSAAPTTGSGRLSIGFEFPLALEVPALSGNTVGGYSTLASQSLVTPPPSSETQDAEGSSWSEIQGEQIPALRTSQVGVSAERSAPLQRREGSAHGATGTLSHTQGHEAPPIAWESPLGQVQEVSSLEGESASGTAAPLVSEMNAPLFGPASPAPHRAEAAVGSPRPPAVVSPDETEEDYTYTPPPLFYWPGAPQPVNVEAARTSQVLRHSRLKQPPTSLAALERKLSKIEELLSANQKEGVPATGTPGTTVLGEILAEVDLVRRSQSGSGGGARSSVLGRLFLELASLRQTMAHQRASRSESATHRSQTVAHHSVDGNFPAPPPPPLPAHPQGLGIRRSRTTDMGSSVAPPSRYSQIRASGDSLAPPPPPHSPRDEPNPDGWAAWFERRKDNSGRVKVSWVWDHFCRVEGGIDSQRSAFLEAAEGIASTPRLLSQTGGDQGILGVMLEYPDVLRLAMTCKYHHGAHGRGKSTKSKPAPDDGGDIISEAM